MAKRRSNASKFTSLSLMALMCTISPIALREAAAQETQPGDACLVAEAGFFRIAADDTPGPASEGQNFLFCDGTNWRSFLQYNDASEGVLFRAPDAAPGDALFGNSHWSMWLDETNDQFELKARKSDGTIINSTVGLGGGGLWTDNTTHITYTGSAAHFINTGQTLPAGFDGNGARMFFYPDKEAFRGGEITGGNDAWQDANIGTHSFAWGENSEASGSHSVAMGRGNTASGTAGIALGEGNTASGGFFSVALGEVNVASGNYSIAMGFANNVSGFYSTAIGGKSNTVTSSYGMAIGTSHTVGGTYATAIGLNNTSAGNYSTAIGVAAESSGDYSLVLGNSLVASGERSAAFGNYAIAGSGTAADGAGDGAMAFGLVTQSILPFTDSPQITGDRSAVFFFDQNTADSLDNYDFTASDRLGLVGGQLQIGETQLQGAAAGCIQFNEATDQLEWSHDCTTYNVFGMGGGGLWTDNTTHITREGAHIVDIGQALPATLDDDGARMFYYPDKEAFRGGEIISGNDAWQDANIGTHSFAWGQNAEATGNFSVAMGTTATATGNGSVAMGFTNTASNFASTAMGGFNNASNDYGVALGNQNLASGVNSVAIGYSNTAGGTDSVAIGGVNTSTGYRAVAMGSFADAGGNRSVSIGSGTESSGAYSFSFGRRVTAGSGAAGDGTGDSAFVFGLHTSSHPTRPVVTGDRSAVFFFDSDTANANSAYDFTASDRLGLVGGQLQIGETQLQGAAAGCIQFNEATDQLEWSHDCTTYNAFSAGGAGLWTDNTTHITRENFSVIDTGQALPAGFDAVGSRAFYYVDKEAFRGGEIGAGINTDAWQDANIGTHSFAWGRNVEASGNYSVALGSSTTASGNFSMAVGSAFTQASGNSSFAQGFYSYALGDFSVAFGGSYNLANGSGAIAIGTRARASGVNSLSFGSRAVAGSSTAGDGTGDNAMAFGLQTNFQLTEPVITGDRSAVFFFDGGVNNVNSTYDFTASDRLGLVGGQLQIGETQVQGAAAGCIQFNEATDQLEWSHDCTTYNAFSAGGAGLWTDNTTHITREGAHIVDIGQALPATLDDDGARMFYYPDKEAFRGGEITGGDAAWQDANIGTHSFAWGQDTEASGNNSVAFGQDATAGGTFSVALGRYATASNASSVALGRGANASNFYSTSIGLYSVSSGQEAVAIGNYASATAANATAIGRLAYATGGRSVALGTEVEADGLEAIAMGIDVYASGDNSMAFGLISDVVNPNTARPRVSGDRSAVFFFDSNTDGALDNYDFTATDRLGLVGGQLQIGETQLQGAASGCIQFNEATDQLEWSHDCTTYNAFSAGGAGLWTDNTTHITRENFNIIDTGQALPAGFDADGTRAFYYVDKEAFRGGEITGGNDAWQDANIGTHSFAWGVDVEASGSFSVALGAVNTASSPNTFAAGYNNTVSGLHSAALGYSNTVSSAYSATLGAENTVTGNFSIAFGRLVSASGSNSMSFGKDIISGSGTAGDGAGDNSMAFGLQTAPQTTDPIVTGDRTAAFVFDSGVVDANSGVDITADDSLIVYGGQVGIGMTTTPDVALDVIGDIEYTGIIRDMSDRRLKENIEELTTGQLQKIIALQAVSFTMKDDEESQLEFGLIAQDVLEIYPELVYENKDGMMSVNYVGLIAPMAEAIEEQHNIIEEQKSRIDLLEERLKALEEKIQTGATVHGLILSLLALGL